MSLSLIFLLFNWIECSLNTNLVKRAPIEWPDRFFAPYVGTWKEINLAGLAKTYGSKYYTLAFVIADWRNRASWNEGPDMYSGYYSSQISALRAIGGDVIISFGGAAGRELALAIGSVSDLVKEYQSVIDQYGVTKLDFDVEGFAAYDAPSIDRRSQAIAQLQKRNPNLYVSFTLATTPYGLDQSGLEILRSALKYGVNVAVVNLMTMNFGNGNVPNPATGMGGYCISAASAAYKQIKALGLTKTTIGITPLLGKGDPGAELELFRIQDARQVLSFAQQNLWVRGLFHWCVNNDNSATTTVPQTDYQFTALWSVFSGYYPKPTPVTKPPNPTPSAVPALGYKWGANVFAPMIDTVQNSQFDIISSAGTSGVVHYNLAFITSDVNGKPVWGGKFLLSNKLYSDQITKLRQVGGEVIASFGGIDGSELAMTIGDVKVLTDTYQSVIDLYGFKWLDFNLQGRSLSSKAAIDRRNQVLRTLQTKQPSLKVTYTFPTTVSGISADALYVLQSAQAAGVRVDVVNILALDWSAANAPNDKVTMASNAIQACTFTYGQLMQIKSSAKLGVTVM